MTHTNTDSHTQGPLPGFQFHFQMSVKWSNSSQGEVAGLLSLVWYQVQISWGLWGYSLVESSGFLLPGVLLTTYMVQIVITTLICHLVNMLAKYETWTFIFHADYVHMLKLFSLNKASLCAHSLSSRQTAAATAPTVAPVPRHAPVNQAPSSRASWTTLRESSQGLFQVRKTLSCH